MSRHSKNREGMTWIEWVCAAGKAVIDDGGVGVWPYSSSYVRYQFAPRSEWDKDTVLLLVGGNIIPKGIPKRQTRTHYPRKLRQAWLNGEDPTEYRR